MIWLALMGGVALTVLLAWRLEARRERREREQARAQRGRAEARDVRRGHARLVGLLVLGSAGLAVVLPACSLLGAGLDQPVTTQTIDPETGLATAPVPVMDPDGTTRTAGEAAADRIEGTAGDAGSVVGGIIGAATGNPTLGFMIATMLAQGGAGIAASLRKKHPGTAPQPPATA